MRLGLILVPLRAGWPSVLLVVGLTSIVAASLSSAEWVKGDAAYHLGLWLGLSCGAALAASRFRGRTALAYSLLLSYAAAGQAVGNVMPSLASLIAPPVSETVWAMHLRMLTLLARMAGWASEALRGETVPDTGFFVFLVYLLTWNAGAQLAWSVARSRRALEGVFPLGILLALNVHLADQSPLQLVPFILGAVLVVARTGFTGAHADWARRQVGYPEELGLEWFGSASAIALVIGGLAAVAPLVASPEGWQALARAIQRGTSETAVRLFPGVQPPRVPIVQAVRTPRLDWIGPAPEQGDETIMWVWVSDPAPPPRQVDHQVESRQHYWRSSVYTNFTGTGWARLQAEASVWPGEDPSLPPAGRYLLRQHFELSFLAADELFAVNLPTTTGKNVWLREAAEGTRLLYGKPSEYDITSLATAVTQVQLLSSPPEYPAVIASTYLQLPESLPARVRTLAARVTTSATSPFEKAVQVQDYLRASYPYSLEVPPPPPGRDAVDYFLFEAPGGFCTYYASAMTVMLRAEGVPARVASGYAMGIFDPTRGMYRVPAGAAHAWVEVYFPGYGWVEFEPTPARAVFDYEAGIEAGPAIPSQGVAQAHAPRLGLLAWILGSTAIILPACGYYLWRREQRGGAITNGRDRRMARMYLDIRRSMKRLGYRASPSQTPDEFLSLHADGLAKRPALREAITLATALYLQASFSRHELPEEELAKASRLWRQALPERVSLWIRARFGRLAS